MQVAIAQINSVLGDFNANREKILQYVMQAHDRACDLIVFPEAALFGYHPADLLERASIAKAQMQEFAKLEKQIPAGIAVLVGLFRPSSHKRGKPFFNSAALIIKGKKTKFFDKELLPTYDVLDRKSVV